MGTTPEFILGEFTRTLDERFRVTLPAELIEPLLGGAVTGILAKQAPGCLSLWNQEAWQQKLDAGVELVRGKLRAGRLEGRTEDVQQLSRLLSTRHKVVELAARGRLLIPDGFREFLQVEKGGELFVIGAGLCIELWRPAAWYAHLEQQMPAFQRLFDELSG